MSKTVIEVWAFASESNPAKEYQTLRYDDRTTSCNCRGWTLRVDANGNRCCRHTMMVDMGTADRNAKSHYVYGPSQNDRPSPQPEPTPKRRKGSVIKGRIVAPTVPQDTATAYGRRIRIEEEEVA